MYAIWLLGTSAPFAFLTTLGEASGAPLGATAIVSIVLRLAAGDVRAEAFYMASASKPAALAVKE